MMKSFFKKLSLVMALAMVVSMMAPAGSAFAAEAGVSIQGTKTIVETYELEKVGATVDFSFQGAPSDWKKTFEWTTSDPSVATVDKAGIVTAVAAGTATITITAGADASYVETVVVTVKEEKPVQAFEVVQTTADTFVVKFAKEQTYTLEDFTVTEIFDTVTVDAPIKASEFKAGTGKEVTIKLSSNFDDAGVYEVAFKKETFRFTASVGEVTDVQFGFYTLAEGCEPVYNAAYIETDEENNTVYLYPQFFDAKGINVTSVVDKDDFSIDYTSVVESDKYTIGYDEISFESVGVASIKMVATWFDEEGNECSDEYVDTIVATKRPALKVSYVAGGVFYENSVNATQIVEEIGVPSTGSYTDDFTNIAWGYAWSNGKAKTEVVLDDPAVPVFAAMVEDNRTPSLTYTGAGYGEITGRGDISYDSSNTNVLEIDPVTGEITAKKVGVAAVLVYFTPVDSDNAVLVGSTKVTVKAARYADSVTIDTNQAKIANAGLDTGSKVVITVKDQYGDKIDLANGAADITVETTSTKNATVLSATRIGTGQYAVYFDASDFAAVTASSASWSYNVTIDKTENKNIDKNKFSFSVRIYNVTEDLAKLLAGTDIEYAVKYEGNHYSNTVDVKVNASNINFASSLASSKANLRDEVKDQKVAVYYVNKNGFRLAAVEELTPLVNGQTVGTPGAVYYTITQPTLRGTMTDNNAVYAASGNAIVWEFNTDTVGGAFDGYATEGNYKVTLYTTRSETNDNIKKLGDYTITVTNSQPEVKYEGYTLEYARDWNSHYENFDDIETVVSGMSKNYVVANDSNIIDAIYECLAFTYYPEVENWNYNNAFNDDSAQQAQIVSYEAKQVSANKIAIKNVTFAITLPGTSLTIYQTIRVSASISR